MYTIYADDKLFYAPYLSHEGYGVFSPKLIVELSKAGSLEFTMPPNNVLYDSISKLKSMICAYQDDELIFRGRVLNDEKDFYKQKKTYCEGELAFLLDSQQRPYSYEGDAKTVFSKYISVHNSKVDSDKQFTVGNVTAASEKTIHCSNDEYATTLDDINTLLIDVYGGYLQTRTENGVHYIDWLADSTNESNQTIEFGVNLLDLSEYIKSEDVFTVIIPIGASQQDSDGNDLGKLDITSVNNGKDYIEHTEGIELFGRIERKQEWSDCSSASELMTLGTNLLNSSVEMAVSLTVTAVDLKLLGVNVDGIHVGDMVRVISLPHNLNRQFQCTKIVYDLENPDRNEYSFGASYTTLTEKQVGSDKVAQVVTTGVKSAISAANSSAERASQAVQEVNTAMETMSTDYVKKTLFDELESRVDNIEANGTANITHSWNGTILTITSDSGTSSADLQGPQGIQGPQGEKGDKGDTGAQGPQGEIGPQGETGAQGPRGEKGDTGPAGADGASATINGVNALTIEAGDGINMEQSGSVLTLSATGGGGGSEVDLSDYATKNYILSRGENLITNGTAFLGDNTNFSSFTFDGSDTCGGAGCFSTALCATMNNDELIPVDLSNTYRWTYFMKTSSASAMYYAFLDMYDIDKNRITYENVSWIANTLTTLAAELKAGDTTVKLTSVANWVDSRYTYQRGFIFWNYKNSFGYQYPENTYSRNVYMSQWTNGTRAINTSTNTITLASAWTGPTIPAGTKVSQCNSGATFVYLEAGAKNAANTWIKKDFTMPPSKFRAGTAFVKLGWLMNYQNSGGTNVTTKLSTLSLTCNTLIDALTTAQIKAICK